MPKHTNSLIHETSPYLLQHAHNPVNWYAWKPEVLEKAKQEDKLVLVSIGYSACHWCHVMEHECFENEEVAELMNKHFINIKIDREERPDIDMVYMTAVQMMTGQGGWPLNCFILPDGRPIYSGTYFPKEQWVNVLNSLVQLHTTNRKKVEEYANELTQGMRQAELFTISKNSDDISLDSLHKSVSKWKSKIDTLEGGPNRAPKFPLPNNYRFLLEYYTATKDEALLSHIQLTLRKMAWGGIYDQLGGGFARYSTDIYWKVPHFEKMLYDNAQLVTLYCEAYQSEKNELYKQVVYETLDFIRKELTSPEGGFYSALDADTEGEEGKYYVWKKEELEDILENDFPVFSDYYSINDVGYWEHGNYVLIRSKSPSEIALAHQLSIPQLQSVISDCKTKLLAVRNTRTKPGLDDKIITSWNALMCKAFADGWLVFQEDWMKEYALKSAQFMGDKLWDKNGHLWHTYKNNQATINGFLDDYAFTIEAFMSVHLLTQDEHWLQKAKQLCDYTLEHFYTNDTGIFYYTNKLDDQLIVRKVELNDNVIPASTSQMAINLHRLARVFPDSNYTSISEQLLSKVTDEFIHYGSGYSNWGRLLLNMTTPFYDIVIIGEQAEEKIKEIHTYYLPNVLILASKQASDLSVYKDRYVSGKTLLYVCKNNTCSLPVKTVKEAINQITL